jgi:hypothetical protein
MDWAANHHLIARVDSPTKELFHQTIIPRNRPVIITGALQGSKVPARWNTDYFRSAIGATEVHVDVSPTNYFPPIDGQESAVIKRQARQMAFAEYADALRSENHAADKLYLSEELLADKFPILAADVEPLTFLDRRLKIINSFWLGSAETVTPLHYDLIYNLAAQVWGRKQFTLFAPEPLAYLYPFPTRSRLGHFSRVNIEQPNLVSFPKFHRARPIECTLEPGEMLYIPPFWWHQVRSLDTAITLNYTWRLSWREYLARPALRLVFPLFLDMLRRFGRSGS